MLTEQRKMWRSIREKFNPASQSVSITNSEPNFDGLTSSEKALLEKFLKGNHSQYAHQLFGKTGKDPWNYQGVNVYLERVLSVRESIASFVVKTRDERSRPRVFKFEIGGNLQKEAELLKRLKGKHHIISVKGFRKWMSNHKKWEVLEFRYLRSARPNNFQELWTYLTHLFEAIDYCHSKGIVHGDIKRDNVLFVNHKAYLIDFGHALYYQEEEPNGCDMGTYGYLPPETLRDNRHHFSRDLWAVGIIILRLTSDRVPFLSTETLDRETLLQNTLSWVASAESQGLPWPGLCHSHRADYRCGAASSDCKDLQYLLKHLLQIDLTKRFTARQALLFCKQKVKQR
jgi:serine/threonine protein kinase